MTWKCDHCQFDQNQDDESFCTNCGVAKGTEKPKPIPPPSGPKIVLVSGADDQGQGPWILSASEVIVGRKDDAKWKCDPSKDIILKDQAVSRPHAKITKEGDKYFVQHMSTVNPTSISEDGSNWADVTGKTEIKPGSKIRVGKTELKFEP